MKELICAILAIVGFGLCVKGCADNDRADAYEKCLRGNHTYSARPSRVVDGRLNYVKACICGAKELALYEECPRCKRPYPKVEELKQELSNGE